MQTQHTKSPNPGLTHNTTARAARLVRPERPGRLPTPGTASALALANEARRTPPAERSPLQVAIAAVFKRDGAAAQALVRSGPKMQRLVGYALEVYLTEFGRTLTHGSSSRAA